MIAGRSPTDVSHLRADLKGYAVRGGAITIGAQACSFLIQLTSVVVLARLLSPEAFGLIAMAAVVTGLVGLFNDLGLSQAVIQREDLTEAQLSSLFWINLGLSCALALVVVALAPLTALVYGEPELLAIMLFLALSFPLTGASVQHRAILARQMRFGRLKAIEIAAALLGLLVGIGCAIGGFGYWSLVAMSLSSALLSTAAFWLLANWYPSRPGIAPGTTGLVRFGLNITGFNLLNYFSRNADNALIGYAWGPASLGLYTRAYGLLMMPLTQINGPIAQVAIPALSRLVDEPEAYRSAYFRIVDKILLVTMPLIGFLIAMSDEVILLAFGDQWLGASPIFFWLGVAALTQPLSNSVGWLFITQGRSDELLWWGLISAPLIVISFSLGLSYGPVGVASAYALCVSFIVSPLLYAFAARKGPVKTLSLFKSLFAFLMLALAAGVAATITSTVIDVASLEKLFACFTASLLIASMVTAMVPRCRVAAIEIVNIGVSARSYFR
jgi:O-antigen/teichoic acid export membrane protein